MMRWEAVCEAAVEVLRGLGATVHDGDLPLLRGARRGLAGRNDCSRHIRHNSRWSPQPSRPQQP